MRIVKIDHIVIFVNDIDTSIRFYKVLGFHTQDAKGRHELSAGDFHLHLYSKKQSAEVQPEKIQPGTLDFCIELDGGIDMLREYLVSQEIEIACDLTPRGGARGAMRSFFVRDPDGNIIEIASYNN